MTAVLVTRPGGASGPLVRALERKGLRVYAIPTVRTVVPPADPRLDEAVVGLDRYDWVVVTSATAVAALAAAAERTGVVLGSTAARWASVGPGTAAAAERLGVTVTAVATEARSSGIPEALAALGPLRGTRLLLPRADAATADLPQALRSAGALVDEVVAYHTVEGPADFTDPLLTALADPALAVAIVASGSAARGLVQLARHAGAAVDLTERIAALPIVSIGPVTTRAARAAGLNVVGQASAPSVEALTRAVTAAIL